MSRAARRFHADQPLGADAGRALTLSPGESHHIARVLRLEPGAAIEIFDDAGAAWRAEIIDASPRGVSVRLVEVLAAASEAPDWDLPIVNLAVAMPKRRAMDWIVEKLSEIGVRTLQPLIARRSVAMPEARAGMPPPERWTRLAQAAAKQCGRNRSLEIASPAKLETWLAELSRAAGAPLAYAHFEPDAPPLAQWLDTLPADAASWILIGPEGGWDPADCAALKTSGAVAVAMGALTLRAETAALAAAAVARLRVARP